MHKTSPRVVATKNKEFDEGEDEDRQFQSERSLNHHQQQWRRQKPEQRIEGSEKDLEFFSLLFYFSNLDSCTGYSARGVVRGFSLLV